MIKVNITTSSTIPIKDRKSGIASSGNRKYPIMKAIENSFFFLFTSFDKKNSNIKGENERKL